MKKNTNTILFAVLGLFFILYTINLAIFMRKYNQLPKIENTPVVWDEEMVVEPDFVQQDSL